jgi:hypothetical protein
LRRPSLDDEILEEFTDGIVLCKLCQILDFNGRDLKGVDDHPRSGASKLNNIRKALGVFRKRKNFPLDYLWSELMIREGNRNVIIGLLMHARKAYGHHLKRNNNTKSKVVNSTGIVKPGFMKRRRMKSKKMMRMSSTSLSIRWRR